jgi:hypothetical protein
MVASLIRAEGNPGKLDTRICECVCHSVIAPGGAGYGSYGDSAFIYRSRSF